jgi:hypothetical protein
MRRTLGLDGRSEVSSSPYPSRFGDRHQQSRRFVRDGEVPVVVVSRRDQAGDGGPASGAAPVNRLALAESNFELERTARLRCERALAEAQATVRELQTKIGHADLARDEAVEAASLLRAENERLKAELAVEQQAHAEAEQAFHQAVSGRESGPRRRVAPIGEPVAGLPRKRGRPPGSKNGVRKVPVKEPKPVKWW